MIVPAVWTVALLAAVSAAAGAGAPPSVAPLESTAPAKSQRSASPPQMCVHRSGGSRAAKALPTYVTVTQGGRTAAGARIGDVQGAQVLPGPGRLLLRPAEQPQSGERSPGRAAPDVCANRIEVSGLRAGWIQVSLHAQGGRPGLSVDHQVEGRIRTVADHRSPQRGDGREGLRRLAGHHFVHGGTPGRAHGRASPGAQARSAARPSGWLRTPHVFPGRLQGQCAGVSLFRVARPAGRRQLRQRRRGRPVLRRRGPGLSGHSRQRAQGRSRPRARWRKRPARCFRWPSSGPTTSGRAAFTERWCVGRSAPCAPRGAACR